MKKVIVFGATGSIGAYVTDYLNNELNPEEYKTIASGSRKTDFFGSMGIEYISVDISKKEQIETLPAEDVYAVILLASVMPGNMRGYFPLKYLETNIIGAYNVLEYCRKSGVNRIIYTQTIRDVGNYIGSDKSISSDLARSFSYTGDHAVYVISKNTAVDLIEHYYQEYGIKRFILRLPTIYLYSKNKYYYVDGKKKVQGYRHIIDQAIQGLPIEMWGDPKKAHDILYVKDLCQMIKKALLSNCDGGVYNAGTGIPVSLEEQIKGIVQVFSPKESQLKIIACPEKPNARTYTLDISKAQKYLEYKPSYDYIRYLIDFKEEMNLGRFDELNDKK